MAEDQSGRRYKVYSPIHKQMRQLWALPPEKQEVAAILTLQFVLLDIAIDSLLLQDPHFPSSGHRTYFNLVVG